MGVLSRCVGRENCCQGSHWHYVGNEGVPHIVDATCPYLHHVDEQRKNEIFVNVEGMLQQSLSVQKGMVLQHP